MIELKELTKKYVLPNKDRVAVLNEVDLRFGENLHIAVEMQGKTAEIIRS